MEPPLDITVKRQSHKFPDRCAHCFKAVKLVSKKIGYDPRKLKADKDATEHPDDILPTIGFCRGCARWQSLRSLVGGTLVAVGVTVVIVLLNAIPFHIPRTLQGWIGAILICILCMPGLLIFSLRDRNVQLLAFSEETFTFSFKRTDYADEFMKLNQVVADKAEDSAVSPQT